MFLVFREREFDVFLLLFFTWMKTSIKNFLEMKRDLPNNVSITYTAIKNFRCFFNSSKHSAKATVLAAAIILFNFLTRNPSRIRWQRPPCPSNSRVPHYRSFGDNTWGTPSRQTTSPRPASLCPLPRPGNPRSANGAASHPTAGTPSPHCSAPRGPSPSWPGTEPRRLKAPLLAAFSGVRAHSNDWR